MDFTMLLLVFALFTIGYLGFKNHDLKKQVEETSVTNDDLGKTIANHIKDTALLRARLTEATDNVASLRTVIDNKNSLIEGYQLTIEQYSKPKVVESTQYPVAPPDLTKKSNRKWTKGPGGKFVKNT